MTADIYIKAITVAKLKGWIERPAISTEHISVTCPACGHYIGDLKQANGAHGCGALLLIVVDGTAWVWENEYYPF